MASSDDLFELVRSLDKTDRNRVRRFALLARDDGSPPQYLMLFDELCKLDTYDERQFRLQHKHAGFEASFPQNKIYLYNLILDALRGERKYAKLEKPKDLQIRERIEESYLLKQKALMSQSVKRLEKARKEAERYQYYEVLLDVLKLLRTHTNEYPEQNYVAALQEIIRQIDWLGDQIWLNCRIIRLRDELFLAARSGVINEQVEIAYHELLKLKDTVEASTEWPVNLEAFTNFHFALSLYFLVKGDSKSAWSEQHQVYILWRDLEDFREVRITRYRRLLYNYLGMSIQVGEEKHIVEALESLERGPFQNQDEQLDAKQDGAYLRLQYFLSFSQWDNALAVEAEYREGKEGWVNYKMSRNRLLAFNMSFARLNLMVAREEAARHYLGFFSDEHQEGIHDDKLVEARVLGVLILFGKSDADIENAIRAARRFIKTKPQAPAYYDVFLKGLSGILNKLESERRPFWDELIRKVEESAGQVTYDGGFHLIRAWAKSQRDGKRLQDYID